MNRSSAFGGNVGRGRLGAAHRGILARIVPTLHDVPVPSRVALIAEPLDFLTTGMMGGGMSRGTQSAAPQSVAVFAVTRSSPLRLSLPKRLSDVLGIPQRAGERVRRFMLTMTRMQWAINGRTFEMEEVAEDERVRFGDSEVWEFSNASTMMSMPHPMHVHGVQFRVLRRDAVPVRYAALARELVESGPKDTVLVFPGERVRLAMDFTAYPGLFAYHCHNLEHEDMGMMRNYAIT